jgi:4,5-DOPA dioxygenase extradiol
MNKKTVLSQETAKMPVLFIGHGSPLNAVEDNQYTRAWKDLGARLPRPHAILSISAHWLTLGTVAQEVQEPETMHDYYGFPKKLYDLQYRCPGAPGLADKVKRLVGTKVAKDMKRGIDHGTWVPLQFLFPHADVPVLQLSIDEGVTSASLYALGKELAPLREQGVLIMGSGDIVHNLGKLHYDPDAKPYDWAVEFDDLVKGLVLKGDHQSLIAYEDLGSSALLSVPSPDHYWPLLYTLALWEKDDEISFPVSGIAHGSVSMSAIAFGLPS